MINITHIRNAETKQVEKPIFNYEGDPRCTTRGMLCYDIR